MLHKKDEQGVSLYDRLKQVEKQTGKRPKDLNLPKFPNLLSSIWSAFLVMSRGRRSDINGLSKLTTQDILNYNTLYNERLLPREIDLLFRIDDEYIKVING